jgi:glycerophosphoryl diester phosphodiesterase
MLSVYPGLVRPAVHGHRGARALYPENTLPGFVYAIQAGADLIELDVLATADDRLVACHDPVLRRRVYSGPGGPRRIREMTLEQLRRWDCGTRANPRFPRQRPVPGARIPTLEEVLELAALGRFGFNIELKSFPRRPWLAPPPERLAALAVETIERLRLSARVMVQSFDFKVLGEVRRLAPGIRLSALSPLGARSLVSIGASAGTPIVGPYYRLVTPARVAAAHRAGLSVIPWTVNRPRAWERLIRAGVDGIITDDPGALVSYLRSF